MVHMQALHIIVFEMYLVNKIEVPIVHEENTHTHTHTHISHQLEVLRSRSCCGQPTLPPPGVTVVVVTDSHHHGL